MVSTHCSLLELTAINVEFCRLVVKNSIEFMSNYPIVIENLSNRCRILDLFSNCWFIFRIIVKLFCNWCRIPSNRCWNLIEFLSNCLIFIKILSNCFRILDLFSNCCFIYELLSNCSPVDVEILSDCCRIIEFLKVTRWIVQIILTIHLI